MIRRLGVMTLSTVLLLAMAAPAQARDMYLSRTTGLNASANWTQYDGTPTGESPLGNTHVGWLDAYGTSNGVGDAFVYVDDFDCEPGQTPWGGGHGEEDTDGCSWLGTRYGYGYGMVFNVTSKLTSATLIGTVEMYGGGHGDGGLLGTPSVNVTFTGVGTTARSMSTYRWSDGGTSYSDRYRSTSRQAQVSGNIGAMGFDPANSSGYISSFSSHSSGRTK